MGPKFRSREKSADLLRRCRSGSAQISLFRQPENENLSSLKRRGIEDMTIAPILAQGPTSNMPAVIFHLITSVRQLWRTTPVLLARVQTSILLRSRWKLSNLASYMLLYTIIGDRVYRRCYLRGPL